MGKTLGPINLQDISISPEYRQSHWQEGSANNDWERMVDIFEDRMESTFLRPIRLVANDYHIGEFSGFSRLALDCLIVETLNQFYHGLDETEGQHEMAFWKFFKNQEVSEGVEVQTPSLLPITVHDRGIEAREGTEGSNPCLSANKSK